MLRKQVPSGAILTLLAAVILAGCNPASTTGAQSSPTSTATTPATATTQATVTPTSTPTSTVHGDWQTYSDATYGFRIDVPAVLSLTHTPDGNAVAITLFWQYAEQGSPPTSQALFAETSIGVYATNTLTDGYPNPCTQGTLITIGSGVPAYEDDSLDAPPPPPGAGRGEGGFDVNLATGGVYFHIYLIGTAPKETFRARYSAIWQHILDSFVPGPAVPNGHPCG